MREYISLEHMTVVPETTAITRAKLLIYLTTENFASQREA